MNKQEQRSYQLIALVIGLGIFFLSWLNQFFNWQLFGATIPIFSALSTLVGSLILWLFVATDWSSLLTLVSLSLIPGLSMTQIMQWSFGNTTFVFLLFTFVVMHALNQTTCLKRLARYLLHSQWAMSHPRRFLFTFLVVVLLLSSFISPTVIFMFLLPLCEELFQQFGWKKGDKLASYFMIAVFVTIAIGTAMTPINHVFAITAMSLYQSVTNQTITNGQYMTLAVPAGLVLFMILWLTIRYLMKEENAIRHVHKMDSLTDLPPLTKREKWIVALFVGMVAMWLVPEFVSGYFPELTHFFKTTTLVFPPLVITILLAVITIDKKPLLNISQAMTQGVHWPSLLLVGATLTLGTVLSNEKVGVMTLLSEHLSPLFVHLSPLFIVLFFITWSLIQTNVTSNLVTVSVVTTLALTLYQSTPLFTRHYLAIICCLIGFMASLAFLTPPAMPYVAIAIGTGWTTSKDTFLLGSWLMFWCIMVAIGVAYPIGLIVFN